MSIKVKIPNSLSFIIDSILPILQFSWAGLKLILTGCLSPPLSRLQLQDKPLSRFRHNFRKECTVQICYKVVKTVIVLAQKFATNLKKESLT